MFITVNDVAGRRQIELHQFLVMSPMQMFANSFMHIEQIKYRRGDYNDTAANRCVTLMIAESGYIHNINLVYGIRTNNIKHQPKLKTAIITYPFAQQTSATTKRHQAQHQRHYMMVDRP